MTPNPYEQQDNAEPEPCSLCGGTEEHDKNCHEMHRCPECWALPSEPCDSQCTRAGEARAEPMTEARRESEALARRVLSAAISGARRERELVDELLLIARAAGVA